MRKPVTTDVGVLQGWPKGKPTVSSADIAQALGITVFQITARLKGMEGRGFVARDGGLWKRTDSGVAEAKNPSPSVAKTDNGRLKNSLGVASGPPDDSRVPVIKTSRDQWAPSEFSYENARKRLPEIEDRLTELRDSNDRRAIMALEVERQHCTEVVSKKRKGKWIMRRVRAGVQHVIDVYVAPDGKEYVQAATNEVADLIVQTSLNAGNVRLRLYTTSALSKSISAAEKENAKREAAKAEQEDQERIRQETIQAGRWAEEHPNGKESHGVTITREESQALIKAGHKVGREGSRAVKANSRKAGTAQPASRSAKKGKGRVQRKAGR